MKKGHSIITGSKCQRIYFQMYRIPTWKRSLLDIQSLPKVLGPPYEYSILNDTYEILVKQNRLCPPSRCGSRPSHHSQSRLSDCLAYRFLNRINLSTQIESHFSRLLTPVPTDICCTLGIPQQSGNLAIVIT